VFLPDKLSSPNCFFPIVFTALTECQKRFVNVAKTKFKSPGLMDGPEYPSCDPAGLFQPKQCLGFTGACWCVVPETGTAIPGKFNPDGRKIDCSSESGIPCFMSSCSSFYFGNGFALTADILV